jgi:ribonuclease P protein component
MAVALGPPAGLIPSDRWFPVASPDSSRFMVVGRGYESLRGRRAFADAYRRGSRRSIAEVTVIVAPGPSGPPQVGFVAGRAVGNAVARNRAKRRLREAAARCSLQPDTVYLLVATRSVLDARFERLTAALAEAIETGRGREEEA